MRTTGRGVAFRIFNEALSIFRLKGNMAFFSMPPTIQQIFKIAKSKDFCVKQQQKSEVLTRPLVSEVTQPLIKYVRS
jgi:hypothetical protein